MAYVTEDEGYDLLAKAIVVQTAEDYGNALLGNVYRNGKRDPFAAKEMLAECVHFFNSEDLIMYTKIPGKTIMAEIEKQIKHWPRKRKFIMANII